MPKYALFYINTQRPRITRGIISTCTLQTDDLFLASGSEPTINVSGEAGHKIVCWLATAHQEKIVSLKGLSGYTPPRTTRETCSNKVFCIVDMSRMMIKTNEYCIQGAKVDHFISHHQELYGIHLHPAIWRSFPGER